MAIQHLWTYQQDIDTDDTITHTLGVNFPPSLCVVFCSLSAHSSGGGNIGCFIEEYRQRQANDSDTTTHLGESFGPNRIRVDNCTSVTFKSYIYYSGGYLTSLPVVTLWG